MPRKKKTQFAEREPGMEESPWWPEFTPEILSRSKAAADAGNPALLARLTLIKDQRLELRAVNQRWPVPKGLRERMVYDAGAIAMDPTKDIRFRLAAQKILVAMDHANNVAQLPDQMTVNIQHNTYAVNVNDFLATVEADPRLDRLLDGREFRPDPGAPDDYAE
jgi:hypothetical protein